MLGKIALGTEERIKESHCFPEVISTNPSQKEGYFIWQALTFSPN